MKNQPGPIEHHCIECGTIGYEPTVSSNGGVAMVEVRAVDQGPLSRRVLVCPKGSCASDFQERVRVKRRQMARLQLESFPLDGAPS